MLENCTASDFLTPRLLRLYKERYSDIPIFCGDEFHVGIPEIGKWADWTKHDTTSGQKRIEAYLLSNPLSGGNVLHVGIGNSSFARDFQSKFSTIFGISVTPEEVIHANQLSISNYYVALMNKHSLSFSICFRSQFEIIIDNNPSTFACCFFHLLLMLRSYKNSLKEGGVVITEHEGLSHRYCSNPKSFPSLGMDRQDWTNIMQEFGFITEAANESVFISRLV